MKTASFKGALAALFISASASVSNASLLVGWHDFDATANNEAPDYVAAGFSGVVSKGGANSVDTGGTNDATYGNVFADPVPINDGFARIGGTNLTFSMTNSSATAVQLGKLLFDAGLQTGIGTVSVAYQIGAGPLNALTSVVTNVPSGSSTASANYGDYAINLMGVPILAVGQTISFVFTANPNARIDNVAITPIPEPSSLLALGCLLTSGLFLRYRRRSTCPSLSATA